MKPVCNHSVRVALHYDQTGVLIASETCVLPTIIVKRYPVFLHYSYRLSTYDRFLHKLLTF